MLFCITATLAGSLVSADWQAFGHDPCRSYSVLSSTSFNNTINQLENYTMLSHTNETLQLASFGEHSFISLSINASLLHAKHCGALSTQDHVCYWNAVSRVTGKICTECHPVCKSQQRSINFIQFSIGFSVILFVSQLFLTSVYSVASDYTPKRYQVSTIYLRSISYTAASEHAFYNFTFSNLDHINLSPTSSACWSQLWLLCCQAMATETSQPSSASTVDD